MFGSILSSKAQRIRRTGIVAGAVGLAVTAAIVAPQAFGNAAEAPARSDRVVAAADTETTKTAEAADTDVTNEQGVALAGFGELNGRQVFVEIYGNSLYGSQATVTVEQRGGPNLSASIDLVTEDLLDGDVEFDVALERLTRGGPVPTRSRSQVAGSWETSGEAIQIDDTFSDAGYLIEVKGTNTPLAADVVVTIDGQPVTVEMHDAFAFDLSITRTAL